MLQEIGILLTWSISNLRAVLRLDCCVDALMGYLDCVKMVLMVVLRPNCGRICELYL